MTATPNFASGAVAEAAQQAVPALSAGPFVLNLCSSTTPMALAQTDLPELRRFHFFVSRRFEEGRERFRLHMGYFATLAEAEEWLGVVREIYPGAWAGETPGRKLRERAAAAAAAQAQHAAGPSGLRTRTGTLNGSARRTAAARHAAGADPGPGRTRRPAGCAHCLTCRFNAGRSPGHPTGGRAATTRCRARGHAGSRISADAAGCRRCRRQDAPGLTAHDSHDARAARARGS